MGYTTIQIQAMIRNMDESMRKHRLTKRTNPEKYKEFLMNENEVLFNEFPSIFDMHMEGKLDATFFEMLKLRREVELGRMTDDEASRIVGQKLFDRYVSPVVNNTPAPEKPMTYEEFYKQFDNK